MFAKINIEFCQNQVPDFSTIHEALCDAIQEKIAFSQREHAYEIIDPATGWATIMILKQDNILLLLIGKIMDYATGVLLKVLQELGGEADWDLPSFANMTLKEFTENEDLDQWIRRWTLEEDDGVW